MPQSLQAPLAILGRLCLVAIFALSAVSNKIPNFSKVAQDIASLGVPLPSVALAGAIAFLLVGSVLVAVGYRARFGALLLVLFLIPATLMAHGFWQAIGTPLYQVQLINFFKNLSMAGGLVFILATKNQPVLLPRPTPAG